MNNERVDRYEILRRLAIAGAHEDELTPTVEMAIRQASDLVGLGAAAMYLWDDDLNSTMAVSYAESDAMGNTLASLEEDLFRSLRAERQMVSAYISFAGEKPMQSFTLPLQHGEKVFGAVIGIQEGGGRLVSEDAFLEAVCAAIALNVAAEGIGKDTALNADLIDKERLGAVIQAAVTVNHEINNPLTAILGNVQLLLMKRNDLDKDLSDKLKTIEASALKIRDVTQRLLKIKSTRSIPYTEGTTMLDLSGDDSEEGHEGD